MGQSTSGTSLVANATEASRRVCYRFRVDWTDAGFGSTGSWTDESAYVKTASGDHQAVSPLKSIATLGRGVSDKVTVTCRNPEASGGYSGLRFSPSNTNGPLYSYIASGGMFMKRAIFEMGIYNGGTAERLRQVTGYITDADEDYEGRSITFTIRDRGADAALTQASTSLYTEYTSKQYMQALAALMERDAVAAADQQFDTGMMVTPYQWCDDESVWDEMGIVAEAQMGRIWFDKDGDLHFDDGSHFIKPSSNSYDDPTTSQATFAVTSFKNLQPQVRYDLIYNHIVLEYQPRYIGQQQTVFSSGETVVVRPSSSLTLGYLPFNAEFRYPVYSVTTPVSGTDYVAVTAGGIDISSDISITMTSYASYADLHITNTNSDEYTAYLVQLDLRGYPLLTEESGKYEVSDATSIATHGKRTLNIRNNPYIQSYRHAQAVGDFALARFKEPIQRIRISGVPARPWLEVGDRVTVTETLTGTSGDWFIEGMSWQFTGKDYPMSLDLVSAGDLFAYTNYFTIGTSTYGTNGRLFW